MNIDKLNTRDAVRAGYWAVLALADRLDHEYTADGAAALAGQVLAAGHALTVLGEDPAPEVDPEVGALVEEGLREKVAGLEWALETARDEITALREDVGRLEVERDAARRALEGARERLKTQTRWTEIYRGEVKALEAEKAMAAAAGKGANHG